MRLTVKLLVLAVAAIVSVAMSPQMIVVGGGASRIAPAPASVPVGQSHAHVVDGVTFTWTYTCGGGDCQHGQFVDGTWWVRHPTGGDVVLVSVSPDDAASGLEKNPATGTKGSTLTQGLYANSGADATYDSDLDLSTQLPYSAAPDDGVYVKAKAYTGGSCSYTSSVGSNCLDTYDAVTVVEDVPAALGAHTFRPGMAGDTKLWVTTSEIDLDELPRFDDITDAADYAAITARWGAPFPRFYINANPDSARRWAPKARNIGNYSADIAETHLVDLFGLLGTGALTDAKKAAVYALVQSGIDIYSGYMEDVTWVTGAGQGQGYWQAVLFYGALTTNTTVKTNLRLASANAGPTEDGSNLQFTEIHQVREGTDGDVIWGGYRGSDDTCLGGSYNSNGLYWGNYAQAKLTGSSNKNTCGDPYGYIDGPSELPGSAYAACCSTGGYVGLALLMKIWPAFDYVANYSPMKAFVERVMDGAGWWVDPDPISVIDPREPTDCNPFSTTTAAATCDYWGVTWGIEGDGTAITIAEATTAGHPSPGPRWASATYHLQGRPTLLRNSPGVGYWDTLKTESWVAP